MKLAFFSTLAIFIIVFATLGISSCTKNEVQTKTIPQRTKKLRQNYVEVTIVRGIDLYLNGHYFHCIAGGPICEFHMWIGQQYIGTGEYKAVLRKTSSGKLEAELQKQYMDDEILSYFENGIMDMPQERAIDVSLIETLGFDENYTISAGEYAYTETSSAFIVQF